MGERAFRRLDSEMGGEFTVGRDMALLDTGTLLNPLVGRFDFLGQFVVGDDPFWQVGAAPLNDGPYHSSPPLACSAGVVGSRAVGASAVEIPWCNLPRPSTSLFLYS